MSIIKKIYSFNGIKLISNVVRSSNYEDMDIKLIKCPECLGTGYDFLDGGQCGRCGGLGVIEKF